MRTVTNSKLPFASVTRVMAMVVSRFVSVTVAPGTTPPVLSLTVPTTDAVSNCAYAAGAHSRSRAISRANLERVMLGTRASAEKLKSVSKCRAKYSPGWCRASSLEAAIIRRHHMVGLLKPAAVAPPVDAADIDRVYRAQRRRVFAGIFVGYAAYYLVRNNLALAIPD